MLTTRTASAPYRATTGTSTTVMAPVGPDTLHARSPEDRGHQPGDDGRDDPGLGAESGGDAEREREREGDDADRRAGEEVAPPRTSQARVVGAPR